MAIEKLRPNAVKAMPVGKHCDGGGLWLFKNGPSAGQWVYRFQLDGRRREMGLGGIGDVTLAQARRHAKEARAMVKDRLDPRDPIREREKARRDRERNLHLLRDVAADCFEARKAELRGDGKAGRWFSPLELHVLPKLGGVPIAEIDQIDIRDCLRPIWHEKGETARKAIGRLGLVMKHAAALGLDVDLQAVEKAKALLGVSRHKPEKVPAMHWRDVPGFYQSLDDGTVTHLALRLLILTGLRAAPVRFARMDQIEGDIWTVPAELMKGRERKVEAFRVPLSAEAMAVIESARQHEREGNLFPSMRKGVISDATMARLMERRDMQERPHGFRSSLRTWLAECTDAPHEVAEACLAHATGGKVVDAYRRTDFLEQRRSLMTRWADHVTGKGGALLKVAG